MRTILFTAGGTGGHIFPGLSVAKKFQAQGYKIVWVGAVNGLENTIIPKHDIPIENINISGLRKKGIVKLLKMPFMLVRAFYQSFKILLHHRPVAVVGFGGYATFPLCVMAFILRVPMFIHEQNAVAGLSNKALSYIATIVFTAFPNVLDFKKTQVVGNPVRSEIVNIPDPSIRYNNKKDGLKVLVVGGSLGANIFNETLPSVFAKTPNVVSIIHQVGRGNADEVQKHYVDLNLNAEVVHFIDDMAKVYSEVDLVVCRAGAATVSEIMCIGVATIFIPYPYAVDNHQYYNAKPLADNGAAYLFEQKDVTQDNLVKIINDLNHDKCKQMATLGRKLAITDSSDQIFSSISAQVK